MKTWIVWICLALLAASGCEQSPPVHRARGIDLTRPLVTKMQKAADKTPAVDESLTEERRKEYNNLLNTFLERADEVFKSVETDEHLNGIEDMAARTNRSFELIDVYRNAYDTYGASHYIAPRLAWAYLNLGQASRARHIVDASIKARPSDARNFFIHGYLLGREKSQVDANTVREVRKAWGKALQLDPELKHLYGVRVQIVRDRIRQMDEMLKAEASRPSAPSSAPASTPSSAPAGGTPAEMVAQADVLLQQGNHQAAFRAYSEILKRAPNHRRAHYGQAVAAWRALGKDDAGSARSLLDKVAAREDLTGREAYELGLVFVREVGDKGAGVKLWERAKTLDAALAAEVGLEQLIQNNQP